MKNINLAIRYALDQNVYSRYLYRGVMSKVITKERP